MKNIKNRKKKCKYYNKNLNSIINDNNDNI